MPSRPLRFRAFALFIAALASAALGGCATHPRRDLTHLPGTDGCFWTRDVFSWTVLDPSTLVVQAPSPNDYYLVKLFAPIPDLKFHERLGFEGGDGEPGRFCRDNGYVVALGPVPQREPVVAVNALTVPQAKRLLANGGTRHTNRG